jgi:hypothetical protein
MSVYDTTVSRTVLVIRDLDPARLQAEARAGLPRLAALEQWLARGEVQPLSEGWRRWLQRTLGSPSFAALPPASIAGAAVADVPVDRPVWLATPLNFVAGLDTVRVHPAGSLPLTVAEQQTLQQDFAREFAGSGCSLHATGRRELLVALGSGYEAGAVDSDDPLAWLGADPREGLPRGAGAGPLRRLGAELEMWLHRHAINEARARRGQLDVNALWIWGGGALVARPPNANTHADAGAGADARAGANAGAGANAPGNRSPVAIAWADDLFVDGFARCHDWPARPLPGNWPAQQTGHSSEVRLVVAGLGSPQDGRSLESIERDWIAPALAEWRRGSHELTLLAARTVVTLRPRSLRGAWRMLRPARPWWQGLLAC